MLSGDVEAEILGRISWCGVLDPRSRVGGANSRKQARYPLTLKALIDPSRPVLALNGL